MAEVLPRVQGKVVLDESAAGGVLPLLELGRVGLPDAGADR